MGFPDSRRGRVLFAGVLALIVAAAVAVPLLLVSSGSDEPKGQAAQTSDQTSSAPEDTDGDGIPDASDPDPFAANSEETGAGEEDAFEEEDAAEPEASQQTVGLNEGAKDDGVGFKALSIEQVDVVASGSDIGSPVYPTPGGKLYKAVVEIKNYGQGAVDPFCADGSAVLLDEKDRNYEPADTSEVNDWVCLDGVAPGFTGQATLAFKVPGRFKLGGLVLWNGDASDSDGAESNIAVLP